MSTYYIVKVHLLALPVCGVGACTQVSLTKREEMEKKGNVGVAKVVPAGTAARSSGKVEPCEKPSWKAWLEAVAAA